MALMDINNRRTKHYTYSYSHVRTFTKTEPVSLSNPTMQPCSLAKPIAHSTASKFYYKSRQCEYDFTRIIRVNCSRECSSEFAWVWNGHDASNATKV